MRFLSKVKRMLSRGSAASTDPVTKQVAILSDGCESSIAYFVTPELLRRGWTAGKYSLRDAPPADIFEHGCRKIIVIRYLNAPWARALSIFREQGGEVIYFMDDDLMDNRLFAELPSQYARKISQNATRWRTQLEAMCSSFWLSSEPLLGKYSDWNASLLSPAPLPDGPAIDRHRIFYHGTASHMAEIKWLAPLIAKLQERRDDAWFEVFGDHSVNKIFRSIPLVSVVHPMSWETYHAYSSTVRRDVGLAPLLPNLFNTARSVTKFYDFARMGAFGIYSDVEPYNKFVRNNIDGILLPNDPQLWINAINELLQNPQKMQRLAEAATRRATEIRKNIYMDGQGEFAACS
jgi:hypothetical protein